jgi:outer membrane protein assembly factor BamB/tetratricopeptide (TPR) repeat protein
MTNTESPDDSSCDSETASSEAHPILSRRDWLTTLSASALGMTVGTGTVSQSARAADPGEQQWQFSTSGEVYSSPAVTDGTAYVASLDGSLYAVDVGTGTQQWQFDTSGRVRSSPAVTDGTVYVGSGYKLYAVDAANGNKRWQFDTYSSVQSSPTVVDGTVYVGSSDESLYAVDAATGTKQWQFDTSGRVWSSPAVADGTVYVGSRDESLYAVDAATGTKQWQFDTDGFVDSSPAVADGTVYVGSRDESLYAVDAAIGERQWQFDTDGFVDSSPAVADGTVYVGSWDNKLYAVDVATGTEQWQFDTDGFVDSEQWQFDTDGFVDSSPAVADGTVYVGSSDESLYAVKTAHPELIAQTIEAWLRKNQMVVAVGGALGVAGLAGAVYAFFNSNSGYSSDPEPDNLERVQWQFDTSDEVYSSPAVADGTVYVGSRDESLYAVDAATDTKQWQFDTSGMVNSSPAVADDTVYVGSYDESLYAVDAATGTKQWQFDTSGEVGSSPAVADGTVYVGSYDESLYAVDAATGTKQWQFDTSGNVRSSPAVADGTVYVGSHDNSLYAVDAATGEQQWQFDTSGIVLSSPAVADGTVYVGSSDESLYAVDAATGEQQWQFDTSGRVWSSPAVADGTVYVGSWDNRLYAVDVATGTEQWQFDTDAEQWQFDTDGFVDSSPAVADGTVYVGSSDESLYVIETTGGSGEHPADTHRGLGQPVGEDNSNSPGSLLSSARELADEATGAREAGDYDRSIEAWQAALNEYERALDAAESKNDTETVSEIESVVQRVKTNLENTRTERRHTEVAELATEARDHVDTGNDAFEDEQFETAREEYEAALSAYQDALEIASGHEFDEADRLNEAITALERDIENCQLRQLAADLESAEATLVDGEYDRAAETFEKLHPQINSLNIDRPDDVGRLRKRAQRGEVRAQLGEARDRLDVGQKAFDDGEYYDARETFQETQDVLNDVLELATDYGLNDLQRNANNMIEVASTNANEARKAVYDIGDVDPALDDVPDVRSGKTEYTPPTERRAEKSRGEGTDPNEPPDDPTPTPQGISRGLHQSPPSHEQIEVLGRGGNATVWKVRRTETGELAALKRPHFRGSMEQEDARRFLREAETWAKVGNHPNVVAVREWGFDGQPWLLMNYCSGGDVSEMVGSVEVESALDILIDVAEALIHARGIDHLDIKPANILIDSDRTAKLADWGLARVAFQHDQTDTSMGMSPPYAAPEQVERTLGPLDSRTDIYQLGVTAYELLTGELPFDPEAPESLERRILHGEPPLPSDVDANIPTEVDVAVNKAMARDRSERYERAIEFRNDLRDIRNRETH